MLTDLLSGCHNGRVEKVGVLNERADGPKGSKKPMGTGVTVERSEGAEGGMNV